MPRDAADPAAGAIALAELRGFNAAISACENGSCWQQALELFQTMRSTLDLGDGK